MKIECVLTIDTIAAVKDYDAPSKEDGTNGDGSKYIAVSGGIMNHDVIHPHRESRLHLILPRLGTGLDPVHVGQQLKVTIDDAV